MSESRRRIERAISIFSSISNAVGLNRILIVGTAVVGLGALVQCSRTPWFEVPVGVSDLKSGQPCIVSMQPVVTNWFQAGAIVFAVLIVMAWIGYRRWRRTRVLLACTWVLIVSAFPYSVMIQSPKIAAHATWLQMQHDNLIWLGGDINTSHEFSTLARKTHVYVVDAPRQVSVIKLPSWSPLEIGLDRFPQLIEWLGYSNTYCQFASKGWFLAVVGGIALLLTSFFEGGRVRFELVGFGAAFLVSAEFVFCVVAWSSPFQASQRLMTAGDHVVRGQYEAAEIALEQACVRLPVLREDTYYVAQRSLLELQSGRDSLFAQIGHANRLERESFYQQAMDEYQAVIHSAQPGSAVRRESLRALLRFAVHSMNTGDYVQAANQLEDLLALEPCNLKAIYMLQLTYLRTGNQRELEVLVDHMYDVCKYFGFPNKKLILATAQQHAAYAAMGAGDIDALWIRWIKMRRP